MVETADLFAISAPFGFVGLAASRADAERLVAPFSYSSFLFQRFARDATGSPTAAWVVLRYADEGVAFVSNVREKAEAVRQALAAVGQAFEDDVDHWEHPVGELTRFARIRLENGVTAAREGLLSDAIPDAPVVLADFVADASDFAAVAREEAHCGRGAKYAHGVEAPPPLPDPFDASPAKAHFPEAQPAEAQPAAPQPAEPQPAEAQPAEPQPAEPQPAEAQPAEAQPAESKDSAPHSEAQPAEAKDVAPHSEPKDDAPRPEAQPTLSDGGHPVGC